MKSSFHMLSVLFTGQLATDNRTTTGLQLKFSIVVAFSLHSLGSDHSTENTSFALKWIYANHTEIPSATPVLLLYLQRRCIATDVIRLLLHMPCRRNVFTQLFPNNDSTGHNIAVFWKCKNIFWSVCTSVFEQHKLVPNYQTTQRQIPEDQNISRMDIVFMCCSPVVSALNGSCIHI
jgi:hypothetical protein